MIAFTIILFKDLSTSKDSWEKQALEDEILQVRILRSSAKTRRESFGAFRRRFTAARVEIL